MAWFSVGVGTKAGIGICTSMRRGRQSCEQRQLFCYGYSHFNTCLMATQE